MKKIYELISNNAEYTMVEVNFDKFVKNRSEFEGLLTPEQTFIVLTLLHNKEYEIVKDYLYSIDMTINYNAVLVYLERTNWLKITDGGVEMRAKWLLFTPKQTRASAKVKEWIGEYCQLFIAIDEARYSKPYPVSRATDDCLKKMSKFVTTYKYDKELILSVTKEYLEERRRDNYAYTNNALSFIDDDKKGSKLAMLCEARLRGEPQTKYKEIKPNVFK